MERNFIFDDGEIIIRSKNPNGMGSALEEVLKKLDRQAPQVIKIDGKVYSKLYIPLTNKVPKKELCKFCNSEVAKECKLYAKTAGTFCMLERAVYVRPTKFIGGQADE